VNKIYIVIVVIALLSVWPFFKKGYFASHDGEWMVIRFTAFHQTLRAGQIPVRFVDRLNNNYGYPVLNFLYPLPFYLSEIPKITGFSFVDSIKITFVISTIVSALAMFWAMSQKFSKAASFTASIVYLFSPYRFVDLYVRGSLGESLAFAILPLILGAIFKISKNDNKYLPVLSVLIACLVLAHNVIALLFLPIFVILTFLYIKKSLLYVFSYILLGMLIATFFWLPALYDLQFVKLSQISVSNPADHVVPIAKLIYSDWKFGPIPKEFDGFSAQIGILSIFILVLTVYLRFKTKEKSTDLTYLVVIYSTSFFLISTFSKILWQEIPILGIIQYPWRILSVIVFTTALLSAYCVQKVGKEVVGYSIALLAITLTITYIKPAAFVDRGEGFYTTNEDSTTVKDEYLPLWVEQELPRSYEKIIFANETQIIDSQIKSTSYKFNLVSKTATIATVNTIYFPGFKASIDKKDVAIDYKNPYGLMTFQLPKGRHEVIIKYNKSPVHLASELISLIAFATAAILFVKLWQKQNS